LNWLMVLPLFVAVLTLPRIFVHLTEWLGGDFLFNAALVFGVLALIYPTVVPALPEVPEVPSTPTKAVPLNSKSTEFWRSVRRFWMEPKQFVWARLVPFALMILSLSVWYFAGAQHSPLPADTRNIAVVQHLAFWVFILPTGAFFVAGIIFSSVGYGTRQFPMHSKAFQGVLIRIFPQLDAMGNWCTFESLDYQRIHKDFPGTSILDQFFTEGPFEAYRKLGQDIMEARIAYQSNQGNRSGLSLVF
jgi:hypothetical protein